MNKEHIYDEQIFPLMGKIIEICKDHKIALVASFHTPNDEDPDLYCATRIPDETGGYPGYLADLSGVIVRTMNGGGAVLMMTTEHGDGTKTMTAILP